MNKISIAVLVFLAFAGLANPVYTLAFTIFGIALVVAIPVRERFTAGPSVFQYQFHSHVYDFRRVRRFIRQVERGGEKAILSFSKGKLLAGIAGLICVCLVAGVVIGMTLVQFKISGSGNIQLPPALAVYADAACTVPVTSIDFGTFGPGETVNRTIYLRNEGGVTGTYGLSTANWNPAVAEQFLGLSWDYGGQQVQPGIVVKVVLHLHASSSLTSSSGVTDFSFDAVISLEG